MSHDNSSKRSTIFMPLTYTEQDYDLIGIVVYKEFRYPAKFTYSLTKYVKIVIQDDDQRNLHQLSHNCNNIVDNDIAFYTLIYDNHRKIKFHGLKLYRNLTYSMIGYSDYCVIYEDNGHEIDWNKPCDTQFSFANIDRSFWTVLGNPSVPKECLTLYDKCTISIISTFSYSDIDLDFYNNLLPKTIEKQKHYLKNKDKINDDFRRIFQDFVEKNDIDVNDIRPHHSNNTTFFDISNSIKPVSDVKILIKLFTIMFRRAIYFNTWIIKQGNIKADILYSFQIKNIPEKPYSYIFSFRHFLHKELFKNWFELYKDLRIQENLAFIFDIIHNDIYNPKSHLLNPIAALEGIGSISNPNIKGNDTRLYIKEALKYGTHYIINDLFNLLRHECKKDIKQDGKISAIAEDIAGYIRNAKAHGCKRDDDKIDNINRIINNYIVKHLINVIICYIFKELKIENENIEFILDSYKPPR